MTKRKLQVGDRVRRSDANSNSIPAYRDMVGTVMGFDWTRVQVLWAMDFPGMPSSHAPEELVYAPFCHECGTRTCDCYAESQRSPTPAEEASLMRQYEEDDGYHD
jgi:hypothetical protein